MKKKTRLELAVHAFSETYGQYAANDLAVLLERLIALHPPMTPEQMQSALVAESAAEWMPRFKNDDPRSR
jgi:LPS sulfotransferase NodH